MRAQRETDCSLIERMPRLLLVATCNLDEAHEIQLVVVREKYMVVSIHRGE